MEQWTAELTLGMIVVSDLPSAVVCRGINTDNALSLGFVWCRPHTSPSPHLVEGWSHPVHPLTRTPAFLHLYFFLVEEGSVKWFLTGRAVVFIEISLLLLYRRFFWFSVLWRLLFHLILLKSLVWAFPSNEFCIFTSKTRSFQFRFRLISYSSSFSLFHLVLFYVKYAIFCHGIITSLRIFVK